MSAYLILDSSHGAQRIPCAVMTTIGRDRNNTLVLSDPQVSRHHAVIQRLGSDAYYLIDSGSANGCRLNGRRITTPMQLNNGDTIVVGSSQLHFEQQSTPAALHDSLSLHETVVVYAPQIREITVLVADMRGFTSLAEQLPIQLLTRLMSEWFAQVSAAISANGGTVDKFIGDCVFARWESDDVSRNVVSALNTACVVNTITASLGTTLSSFTGQLRIGAGINVGQAALEIGSENTALGDAVNTAFRLESASKELGVDVVLSQSAYRHLPPSLWRDSEQSLALKGKREKVQVVGLDFDRVMQMLQQRGP